MNRTCFVETLWSMGPDDFTENVFFDAYRTRCEVEDENIATALASLYLQKLVRSNVLAYSHGYYSKQSSSEFVDKAA